MRIGILGTGMVGKAIGKKLVENGHRVCVGSRSADSGSAAAWSRATGGSAGTFAEAAGFAELVINCTAGGHSLEALRAAGDESLAGKLLVDVANPLEPSGEGRPLAVCNDDSLGEQVQRAFPGARVVKALNTVNCEVMVDPERVPGDHVVFVCGDDAEAKAQATGLLGELGWPRARVVDLGPIRAARATEMYLPLWLALSGSLGTSQFNVEIKRRA